jgi:phospholipid-binding lipoprotein MlaA
LVSLLQGCASAPGANPRDPWEPFNRSVFRFNEGVDEAVVKPVAIAYQSLFPELMRRGVDNFFSNISDVRSLVNNVLQVKPEQSAEMFFRVGVNTTLGLGGLLDVATELRIPRHREDFGQTLGYWGFSSGPYLVLPIMGPSTVRDALAFPVDSAADPVSTLSDVPTRNALSVLRVVDLRASLLSAGKFLDDAALDKYSFTRDAYLQRRRSLIGEVSTTRPDEEERFDLPEPASAASAALAVMPITPAATVTAPAGSQQTLQSEQKTSPEPKN